MKRVSTKAGLIGLAMSLLAGCSADQGALRVEGEVLPALRDRIGSMGESQAVPEYQPLVAAGAPVQLIFSEMTGRFDQMRLQETSADGVQTWISQNGTTVSMQDGIMISSRGLGGDMMSGDGSETRRLIDSGEAGRVTHYMSYLDGENTTQLGAFVCDVQPEGMREVDLIVRKIQTRLISETCYGPDLGFINLYWIGQDGVIWQSRQFAGRVPGIVDFRILAPEAVQSGNAAE